MLRKKKSCPKCSEKKSVKVFFRDKTRKDGYESKGIPTGLCQTEQGKRVCKPCNSSKGNREIDYRKLLPNWINRDGPITEGDRWVDAKSAKEIKVIIEVAGNDV